MSDSDQKIPVKRYFILRIIASIYKLLAGLFTIISIGVTIVVVFTSSFAGNMLQRLLSFGLLYLVSGGLAGLTFYAISRLIDLFLETNDNTRLIAEQLELQNKMLKQIYARQKSPAAVDVNDAIAARKGRLFPDQPDT